MYVQQNVCNICILPCKLTHDGQIEYKWGKKNLCVKIFMAMRIYAKHEKYKQE